MRAKINPVQKKFSVPSSIFSKSKEDVKTIFLKKNPIAVMNIF